MTEQTDNRPAMWQPTALDKTERARQKQQSPFVLWFTGLSGSGKSATANAVDRKLFARGRHTYLLDGDNVRHGLNRDLGFSNRDRVENIRRISEVTHLFMDAGLIVLTAFISPFQRERDMVRQLVGSDAFVEIFMNTPLTLCEQRDPKGLYKKARRGEIAHFTGIDSVYEPPGSPQLILDTARFDTDACAEQVIRYLLDRGKV